LEDACHAPGGHFTDSKKRIQRCGNCNYADTAVFSFHPVKHIACGEGGMVTTNSEDVYKRLLLLRSHGITKENMLENHGGWYYEMQTLGFNYRLTDFQAALGITQLAKNEKGVARRNEIANKYKVSFRGKVNYQSLPLGNLNAHHLFVIEVEDRKELYGYLQQNKIFAQIHYIPVHRLPYYKSIGYDYVDLKNAEDYYSKCISLPMYPTLTDEEQNFVINNVLKFIDG
jgi:dTDP-4-amino-4,6-dideoxygalactose transaminase